MTPNMHLGMVASLAEVLSNIFEEGLVVVLGSGTDR